MEESHLENEAVPAPQKKEFQFLFVFGIALGIFIVLGGAGLTASETYHKDRIFNGIFIGGLDIGGLKKDQARQVLETWHDGWWADKMRYDIYNEQGKKLSTVEFQPIVSSSDQSYQFVYFDLDAMMNEAYRYGRSPSVFLRAKNQLMLLFHPVTFNAIVEVDDNRLDEILHLELEDMETLPEDASFELVFQNDPVIISETDGNTFDYQKAIAETKRALLAFDAKPIRMDRSRTFAAITTEDVQSALPLLESIQSVFPIDFAYYDDRIGIDREWSLAWIDASKALVVTKEGQEASIALGEIGLAPFWEKIEAAVNIEASDAKFTIAEDKKVEQFQPSRKGYALDREHSLDELNLWLSRELMSEETEEKMPVRIVVNTIEPIVSTAEVNNLGITEVLGIGYSNFSGSPANRVHNISIGANKLNGLLIAPGENFSLVQALKPFTISAGYLPELVIKGDKIEPEVAGGLCQIGTTTFRAAMKSGLEINERRNHSLVVSYYNDPRNGNPGTDATIYDASPDLKFTNNTGNYILIETEMNRSNGDLFFTFWGTSDGREADYTEPVVTRWIGTGPKKYIETTDLEPGEERCQGAHVGAETSFTYTVITADGETKEVEYTSSYRPLPTICLIGIDPDASVEGEETDELSATDGEDQSIVTEETLSEISLPNQSSESLADLEV